MKKYSEARERRPYESNEEYITRIDAFRAKRNAERKRRQARRMGFLTEGLATYVEFFTLRQNAHDYFIQQILRSIYMQYGRILDSWNPNTPLPERTLPPGLELQFRDQMEKFGLLFPEQFFDLPAKERSTFLPSRKSWPDYYQGGSFIQYMMDTFGAEVLKDWCSVATRTYFRGRLPEITGTEWDKMIVDWKQAILSRFDQFNIGVDIEGKKLDDQQWAKEFARRQKAKKIFQLLS